jgi:hypothetical protein
MTDLPKADAPKVEPQSGKRPWVRPAIEIAQARGASAFGGRPGGVDYGLYS